MQQRSGGGPQIHNAATDKNSASTVSFMTWMLFLLAHLSTVAYALVNRSGPASRSTPYAVSPYCWSRFGHAGYTRSG
jgi:hypothetical protein